MARRKNNTSTTTKKGSSVGINARSGGKVQKKIPDSKSKKNVKIQIKQAAKSQQQSRSEIKLIPTARSSKRSSLTNTANQNKPTPASVRSTKRKVTTATKAAAAPKTGKVIAASKTKRNNEAETKKRATASMGKTETLNKNEISPSEKKKAESKMSLRGKKRSYAQLASGNERESSVSKKKKTENTKDMISRGSRSIKPTIKGSEWRNTLLQKKSTGAKQEKPIKNLVKSPLKSKSSTATNKSPKQKKKLLTPKAAVNISKTASKKLPSTKRQRRSGLATEEAPKLSPSKNKVKTKKAESVLSKSPRTKNRKSTNKDEESETKSSKVNPLATSIKNKFNTCVSNKRKPRSSGLQENVLVAQGILQDILSSVGTNENSQTDENTEEDSGDMCVSKQETTMDVLPKNMNTDISERKCNKMPVEEEKSTTLSCIKESTKEEHFDNLEKEQTASGQKSEDLKDVEPKEVITNKKHEGDDTLEEIELHLSDTSEISVNELSSSESKSNKSSNINSLDVTCSSNENKEVVDSIVVSENKITENSSPVPLKSEIRLDTNGDEAQSNPIHNETPQLDEEKKTPSARKEAPCNKNVQGKVEEITNHSETEEKKSEEEEISIKSLSHETSQQVSRPENDILDCLDKKDVSLSPVKENSFAKISHSPSTDNFHNKQMDCTNTEESVLKSYNESMNMLNGKESDNGTIKGSVMAAENGFKAHESECNNIVNNLSTNEYEVGKSKENSPGHLGTIPKLNDSSDNHCSENAEDNSEENKFHVERSPLISKTDKSRMSDELPKAFEISSKNLEKNGMSSDAQNVDSDCQNSPDTFNRLNPSKGNVETQDVEHDNNTNTLKVIHHVEKLDRTETVSEIVSSDGGKFNHAEASGLQLDHNESDTSTKNATETCPVISSASVTTENKFSTSQPDNAKETKSESTSSTKTTEGDVNKLKIPIDSTHLEQASSIDEQINFKDIQADEKTEQLSTCLAEDINGGVVESSSNFSTDKMSVENISENSSPSIEVSDGAEMLTNNVENTNAGEEISKMEEGNQGEIISQESIIIDDTDGESMQCTSGTLSSNRMSVDDENLCMEVEQDCEEVSAVANDCNTSEMKMDGKMSMEVS